MIFGMEIELVFDIREDFWDLVLVLSLLNGDLEVVIDFGLWMFLSSMINLDI